MHIEINPPALLFPAISLLLLAYTNRFLGLSSIIRSLHHEYLQDPDPKIIGQLDNLRRRVALIRGMQIVGTLSIFCCVVSMVLVFIGQGEIATWVFGASLLCQGFKGLRLFRLARLRWVRHRAYLGGLWLLWRFCLPRRCLQPLCQTRHNPSLVRWGLCG